MKIRFPKIGAVIFLSSMLVSVVSAAPYNQYQDPIKEQRIAAYTWLYGEALGGNEIAKRNLKVLERIYGPALTDLSIRPDFRPVARGQGGHMRGSPGSVDSGNASIIPRAKEYVSGLYDLAKNLTGNIPTSPVTGPEGSSSKVVTAGADIEEWMEKSGVVSPTVEYSITSFGLTHPPMIHLVSAWVLGNSEKAEPLVRGTGTIARIAVGYP